LEVNDRTLATYIYRGIESLSKKIKEDPRLKNLSYENEISKFIELRLLHLSRDSLKEMFDNKKTIDIFEKLLYEGKSIEEISEILCIDIVNIKKIVKKGIFMLINEKKFLLN
ncbi:MAG: hypothetical protein ACOCUI_03725, partial [bacterium]